MSRITSIRGIRGICGEHVLGCLCHLPPENDVKTSMCPKNEDPKVLEVLSSHGYVCLCQDMSSIVKYCKVDVAVQKFQKPKTSGCHS